MAILKATIKAEIKALTASLNAGDVTKKEADTLVDDFADKLADVVINAIKSADLTIPAGTIITVGSATTQTQSVPGIVIGGLS